ncbi:MAG: hypothetical protein AVDCRST_MAG34-2538, partial [uncultured Nocardioidaceae bacterium]
AEPQHPHGAADPLRAGRRSRRRHGAAGAGRGRCRRADRDDRSHHRGGL